MSKFKPGDKVRLKKDIRAESRWTVFAKEVGTIQGMNTHGFWAVFYQKYLMREAMYLYCVDEDLTHANECGRNKELGVR